MSEHVRSLTLAMWTEATPAGIFRLRKVTLVGFAIVVTEASMASGHVRREFQPIFDFLERFNQVILQLVSIENSQLVAEELRQIVSPFGPSIASAAKSCTICQDVRTTESFPELIWY